MEEALNTKFGMGNWAVTEYVSTPDNNYPKRTFRGIPVPLWLAECELKNGSKRSLTFNEEMDAYAWLLTEVDNGL